MTKRHRYSPEVTFEETLFISAEDEDVLHTDTCDACGHHGAESVPKTGAHWVLFDSDLSLQKPELFATFNDIRRFEDCVGLKLREEQNSPAHCLDKL